MTNRLKLNVWKGYAGIDLFLPEAFRGEENQNAVTIFASTNKVIKDAAKTSSYYKNKKQKLFTGASMDSVLLDLFDKNRGIPRISWEDYRDMYVESGQIDGDDGISKEKSLRKVFQNFLDCYRTDRGRELSVPVEAARSKEKLSGPIEKDGIWYYSFKNKGKA